MLTLDGDWFLAPDPDNTGRADGFPGAMPPTARPAPVPGIIQQVFPGQHGVFWYYTRFPQPAEPGRVLLHFGMVDYLAEVWLNGIRVGAHEGSETPFTFDITEAMQPGEQLLAVRVLNPGDEPIDGIVLAETPHRNKKVAFQPGNSFDSGGILMPVQVEVAPAVRITDLCVRADGATGAVTVIATVQNDTEDTDGALVLCLASATAGGTLAETRVGVECPSGASTHTATLTLDHPHRWDLDDPYLYRATATLQTDEERDERSVRFGFRDFRVIDGFFHLNGRRLFLRSTHTGNHMPIGNVVPTEPDLLRRDLLMAKDSGYNCVRFISGMAYPEQLDFCDEIGLMVYEEHLAAWALGDSPEMGARYDAGVTGMVQRDRNHPSVTIWGMLNEEQNTPIFQRAVDALPLLRALDPTRLVLLGSGRWDGRPGIGSVSNPGSDTWDHVWGVEAPEAPDRVVDLTWNPGGYATDAGDVHMYPPMPHRPEHVHMLRTLGADTKPLFISEYGIGSQFNAIDELRGYRRHGAAPNLEDVTLLESEVAHFTADLARFGMAAEYPFPEDFLRESYAHSIRQRRLTFDYVRSNPQYCGYNLTGMLDHGLTGEGMWSMWRVWKPGAMEVLRDGWAPLRWCLFADPSHGYAGQPVHLEAVLANEDVLPSGDYPVHFRLFHATEGLVWEQQAVAHLPADRLLAVPVLDVTLTQPLPAGEYTFAASMEAAAPAADRRPFRLSAPVEGTHGAVACLGVDDATVAWLAAHGVLNDPAAPVLLIGNTVAEDVAARIAAGATALFLSATPFLEGRPLGEEISAAEFHDWLYHKDILLRRHPVFAGMDTGLQDWEMWAPLVSRALFTLPEPPEETPAAAFAVGYCCPGGYASGVVTASFRRGQGRVILNSLPVLDTLGRHPYADRLLLNLLRYAGATEG